MTEKKTDKRSNNLKGLFTSGPWQFCGENTPHIDADLVDCKGVADLYHKGGDGEIYRKDNWEANGHLIASAPCMFDALELVVRKTGDLSGADLDIVKAVLSRAKGGGVGRRALVI